MLASPPKDGGGRSGRRPSRPSPSARLPAGRRAGELLAAAGTEDAIDAIVAAEALASVPSVVLTSDRPDIRRLLDTQPDGARVAVVRV